MSSQGPESSLIGTRVFVVEDESLVAMLLEDTLGAIGCEIVGLAARFDDALDKAKSLTFDLAILDLNLNGRQTFPIAEALVARNAKFVFATGYGAANLPPSLQWAPVLKKPFAQRDLENALRAALAVNRRA